MGWTAAQDIPGWVPRGTERGCIPERSSLAPSDEGQALSGTWRLPGPRRVGGTPSPSPRLGRNLRQASACPSGIVY